MRRGWLKWDLAYTCRRAGKLLQASGSGLVTSHYSVATGPEPTDKMSYTSIIINMYMRCIGSLRQELLKELKSQSRCK